MGNPSVHVTEQEVEELLALRAKGLTKREICEITGRSSRTLDRYLPRVRASYKATHDPAKYLTMHRTADLPTRTDNRKHLQDLYEANGYGFSWWPPSLMARVYLLESAPPSRPFWRAA